VNRRAASRLIAGALSVLVLATGAPTAAIDTVVAASPAPAAWLDQSTPPRPDTIGDNEFLPDDANLSDCVGLVERPGCGSEERGGWRQGVVFAVLMIGMALIFVRIYFAIRKASRVHDAR
jgi:hypothetical protein